MGGRERIEGREKGKMDEIETKKGKWERKETLDSKKRIVCPYPVLFHHHQKLPMRNETNVNQTIII